MKKIFIIDCYPKGKLQIGILEKCILALKKSGWSILVVAHYQIPVSIQALSNYTIYDFDNSFLPADRTPCFTYEHINFRARINNTGHTLAICRNMNLALNFAKTLGYDIFWFMEFDVIFSEDDLFYLLGMVEEMVESDKKMIFFSPEDFFACGSRVYETLMFGGFVNYFLDKFCPPKNMQEWNSLNMGYTLELAFYEQLSKYAEDFLVYNQHADRIFLDSQINLFRYSLYQTAILPNNRGGKTFFIINCLIREDFRVFEMYLNGDTTVFHSGCLERGRWWIYDLKEETKTVLVKFYINGQQIEKINFDLSDDFSEKGSIEYL